MLRLIWVVLLLGMGACVMAEDEMRTVTVSGVGAASVEPDRATVHMSIVAREKTLDAAQRRSADVSAAVLSLLDDLDIERERVDTTGASISPDYRWDREREEQVLRGYIAQRQLIVDVRDLEQLGAVVEGAVKAGVNQVTPPQLDSGERREAYREALEMAAKDAKANAERLAESLGARLGDVIQISDGSYTPAPVPQPRMAKAMSMEADAGQTYNAADLSFNASITVVFSLKD
ncbi:MAG: SIMPL domain-containing protein [Gammaproteobacteria bacterium]|nr:SIMPL domain-containing protein [Gammaproteobacteria bacterium]